MKLYDYQHKGMLFLSNRNRAYLADVPGLGKTAQALMAADAVRRYPFVVCPASAVPVWEDESRKWGVPLAGVVSYTKLAALADSQNIQELLRKPELVVLDEVHFCKSPNAKRTKAALGLAARAGQAWVLSGTPMPNNPSELYTVFDALWPRKIPQRADTFEGWRDYFCQWYPQRVSQYRTVPKITGVKRGPELREMVRGVMLRRHLEDVNLQLPPLRLHVVPLPADEAFARELETAIGNGEIETPTVRRLLGTHKASRVADVLLSEGIWPVVVMYHHVDAGAELAVQLRRFKPGIRIAGLSGSSTQKERGERVADFQAGKYDVFVVQQQAGGVAITLTRANEIILLEPDWSPEVNAQAIKRVHRISQERPTRARIFKVEGSLDEGIMETLARKIRMRKEILS